MLDTFNFSAPQTSNYQEFYGGGTTRDWIKPRGASMVRMLLIGAGGGGRVGSAAGGGGGSGAVTNWIGPAIFIPDELRISIGIGGVSATNGTATTVVWQGPTASAGYTLLTANGGNASTGSVATGGTGGTASSANNFFGASGIFRSVAGQNGASRGASITASTTTFLSGGAGGGISTANGGDVNTKYGYTKATGGDGLTGGAGGNGYFITQPILLGVGGAGGGDGVIGGNGGKGGIGCGGGGGGANNGTSIGGAGGDGAVFIWSW